MGEMQRDQAANVLDDLLRVVKVAMPPELFAIDPRVIRARQLLAQLRQLSESRPPSVVRTASADEVLDLAFSETPIEQLRPQPEPLWDITLGIDRFMASGLAPDNRQHAVEQIIREWLTANGYLELDTGDPN